MAKAESRDAFAMQGVRDVISIIGSAPHLEQQVNAIERAVASTPNLAFDLARTLIETACKTVLRDCGNERADQLGLKALLRETYATLQLVPHGASTEELQQALQQIIDNLNSVILGISHLRHNVGIASHGKDAIAPALESTQAEFVARAADAIVTFLFKSHYQYTGSIAKRDLEYEDNPDLNDYIDQVNEPVRIFDLDYRPSEVLFFTDRSAYEDVLSTFDPQDVQAGDVAGKAADYQE